MRKYKKVDMDSAKELYTKARECTYEFNIIFTGCKVLYKTAQAFGFRCYSYAHVGELDVITVNIKSLNKLSKFLKVVNNGRSKKYE